MPDPVRILSLSLLLGATAAPALRGQAVIDTTIAVEPGARLDVENFQGGVTVTTWERNAVRVVADGPREAIRVRGGGRSVSVRTEHDRGHRDVEYRITVPAGIDLSVHGVGTDVTIRGSRGGVQAHTVNGDISVEGGRGVIQLNSVQGGVSLSGAEGKAEVASVNDAVDVRDFRGDLKATTVNGEVSLRGVDSASIESTTVNGSIVYEGSIRPDGWYRFNTHNGEVVVEIPPGAGATIQVRTFNGEFQSDFPVTASQSGRGKHFNFTLGDGGAQIEMSAFNGKIRLRSSSR